MEIKKSYWTSNGNSINLAVPFAKVDKERRTVSGFATLDNVDKHGDIVDTSASLNAFTRFRGNIREMHQPIAVGKVVSFTQKDYYDAKTKKNYSGVFVDVYVSKGAQDTWEKVLDGTLSGFSIGGSINKTDTVLDSEEVDGPVRVIKDYDLTELSLVDNPANQFANVFSIQKADIGFKMTGMATTVKALNVFYCDSDEIATVEDLESKECDVCSSVMKNIGWIEDSVAKSADLERVVNSYIAKDITGEGGNEMAKEIVKSLDESEVVVEAVEVTEEVAVEATEVVAEETAEVIEKSVDGDTPAEEVVEEVVESVEEVEVTEDAEVETGSEFEKMLEGIKSYITDTIEKATININDNTQPEKVVLEIKSQMDAFIAKHEDLSKAVERLDEYLRTIQNRMDSYEASTAMKKSNDSDNESMVIKKSNDSIWNGRFLGVQDL